MALVWYGSIYLAIHWYRILWVYERKHRGETAHGYNRQQHNKWMVANNMYKSLFYVIFSIAFPLSYFTTLFVYSTIFILFDALICVSFLLPFLLCAARMIVIGAAAIDYDSPVNVLYFLPHFLLSANCHALPCRCHSHSHVVPVALRPSINISPSIGIS